MNYTAYNEFIESSVNSSNDISSTTYWNCSEFGSHSYQESNSRAKRKKKPKEKHVDPQIHFFPKPVLPDSDAVKKKKKGIKNKGLGEAFHLSPYTTCTFNDACVQFIKKKYNHESSFEENVSGAPDNCISDHESSWLNQGIKIKGEKKISMEKTDDLSSQNLLDEEVSISDTTFSQKVKKKRKRKSISDNSMEETNELSSQNLPDQEVSLSDTTFNQKVKKKRKRKSISNNSMEETNDLSLQNLPDQEVCISDITFNQKVKKKRKKKNISDNSMEEADDPSSQFGNEIIPPLQERGNDEILGSSVANSSIITKKRKVKKEINSSHSFDSPKNETHIIELSDAMMNTRGSMINDEVITKKRRAILLDNFKIETGAEEIIPLKQNGEHDELLGSNNEKFCVLNKVNKKRLKSSHCFESVGSETHCVEVSDKEVNTSYMLNRRTTKKKKKKKNSDELVEETNDTYIESKLNVQDINSLSQKRDNNELLESNIGKSNVRNKEEKKKKRFHSFSSLENVLDTTELVNTLVNESNSVFNKSAKKKISVNSMQEINHSYSQLRTANEDINSLSQEENNELLESSVEEHSIKYRKKKKKEHLDSFDRPESEMLIVKLSDAEVNTSDNVNIFSQRVKKKRRKKIISDNSIEEPEDADPQSKVDGEKILRILQEKGNGELLGTYVEKYSELNKKRKSKNGREIKSFHNFENKEIETHPVELSDTEANRSDPLLNKRTTKKGKKRKNISDNSVEEVDHLSSQSGSDRKEKINELLQERKNVVLLERSVEKHNLLSKKGKTKKKGKRAHSFQNLWNVSHIVDLTGEQINLVDTEDNVHKSQDMLENKVTNSGKELKEIPTISTTTTTNNNTTTSTPKMKTIERENDNSTIIICSNEDQRLSLSPIYKELSQDEVNLFNKSSYGSLLVNLDANNSGYDENLSKSKSKKDSFSYATEKQGSVEIMPGMSEETKTSKSSLKSSVVAEKASEKNANRDIVTENYVGLNSVSTDEIANNNINTSLSENETTPNGITFKNCESQLLPSRITQFKNKSLDSSDKTEDTSNINIKCGDEALGHSHISSDDDFDVLKSEDEDEHETEYDECLKKVIFEKNTSKHFQEISYQDLWIDLKHEIPPLHLANVRPCSLPKPDEKILLQTLGMKGGKFRPYEDAIIKANWEKFSKTYDIYDPAFLLDMRRNRYIDVKRQIMQFLGNGLPHRALHQIHKRFVALCHPRKGFYSKDEDRIILQVLNKKMKEPFNLLSGVLKRPRPSIVARYNMLLSLKAENNMEVRKRRKWKKQFAEMVLKSLMKNMGASSVDELKDRHLTMEDWRMVQKDTGVPCLKLRQFWNYQLHTQLFTTQPVPKKEVYKNLIDWLYKTNPPSEMDIQWADSTSLLPGSTQWYMWEMFRRIRNRHELKKFKSLRDFITTMYRKKNVFDNDRKYLKRYKVGEDYSLSVIDNE